MIERMKDKVDKLIKKWWFGKWACVAYVTSFILFAIYAQMQEGTTEQKVLLVLVGIFFFSGMIPCIRREGKKKRAGRPPLKARAKRP